MIVLRLPPVLNQFTDESLIPVRLGQHGLGENLVERLELLEGYGVACVFKGVDALHRGLQHVEPFEGQVTPGRRARSVCAGIPCSGARADAGARRDCGAIEARGVW